MGTKRRQSPFAAVDWRLIDDPDHLNGIGPAWPLYLYLIRHADFGSGVMNGYTDSDAGRDMGIARRTVRAWRERLRDGGYIRTDRKPHTLTIEVIDIGAAITEPVSDRVIDMVIDMPPQRRDVNPSLGQKSEQQQAEGPADAGLPAAAALESSENTRYTENLEALRDVGIGSPTCERLAALPHVTADCVYRHFERWRHERETRDIGMGILITRIRENEPAPRPAWERPPAPDPFATLVALEDGYFVPETEEARR